MSLRSDDSDLARPTPCQIPVSQLLAHLLGLSVACTDAAAKVDGPTTRTAPDVAALDLPSDWRDQLPQRLDALVTAWHEPSAWTGMGVAGGVELPSAVLAVVANHELLLHGWDLARATDQDFSVADPNLQACWQLVSDTPDDPAARGQIFGPVVPSPTTHPCWTASSAAPAGRPAGPRPAR